MPAQAFFLRHVKGIEMNDIKVSAIAEDFRPIFVLHDVQDADFFQIKVQQAHGTPMFRLKDVERIRIYRSCPVPDTDLDEVSEKTL